VRQHDNRKYKTKEDKQKQSKIFKEQHAFADTVPEGTKSIAGISFDAFCTANQLLIIFYDQAGGSGCRFLLFSILTWQAITCKNHICGGQCIGSYFPVVSQATNPCHALT
jgi:hypothetical protein